jgi:CRP-like cAMP-binding protein
MDPQLLAAKLPTISIRFRRDETLYERGSPAKFIYMVTKGALYRFTVLPDGRRLIFAVPVSRRRIWLRAEPTTRSHRCGFDRRQQGYFGRKGSSARSIQIGCAVGSLPVHRRRTR